MMGDHSKIGSNIVCKNRPNAIITGERSKEDQILFAQIGKYIPGTCLSLPYVLFNMAPGKSEISTSVVQP